MKNPVTNLSIKNFKSIKELNLNCKRINVFIGKPNTGKSNILEALSLLCAGFDESNFALQNFMRYETISNLFYDNETGKTIEVKADEFGAIIKRLIVQYKYLICVSNTSEILDIARNAEEENLAKRDIHEAFSQGRLTTLFLAKENGELSDYKLHGSDRRFKKYDFQKSNFNSPFGGGYLYPPNGGNLPAIIQSSKELRDTVAGFFKEYGLDFVLNVGEKKIEIQKRIENLAYTYPYSLTADTLQRMIFYLAAIKSNQDSVLIFEEPETHTFPSYTATLASNIVQSKENQFFITTHNPYLLDTILEESDYEETAVFKVTYKDYQTHAKELTREEIDDIVSYGADVFINHKAFGE